MTLAQTAEQVRLSEGLRAGSWDGGGEDQTASVRDVFCGHCAVTRTGGYEVFDATVRRLGEFSMMRPTLGVQAIYFLSSQKQTLHIFPFSFHDLNLSLRGYSLGVGSFTAWRFSEAATVVKHGGVSARVSAPEPSFTTPVTSTLHLRIAPL